MYSESRLVQYGSILGDWKIRKTLYKSNEGKTQVYLVVKQGVQIEEQCALKSINIISREDNWDKLSEEDKKDYQEYKQELCIKAEKEVAYMSKLQGYKNIVTYHDFSFADWMEDDQFGCDLLIRMELLSTLADKMKKEDEFSEGKIIYIGMDICQALIHCKENDIMHRDIKPGNIFINSHGDYLLGDFGISKIVNSNMGGSTAIGTIAYAAPEQVLGIKKEGYDERVDIYSLGLTLYQLANTGKMPFAKKKLLREEDNNRRLAGEKIPEPDGVGEGLGNVILKAIEFDPEKRYQTAKDFLYALSQLDKENIKDSYNEVEDIYATKTAFPSENVILEQRIINFKEQNKQEESKTVRSDILLQDKDSEILVENLDELIQLAEDIENPEIEYKISNIY